MQKQAPVPEFAEAHSVCSLACRGLVFQACKEDTSTICYNLQPGKDRTIKSSDDSLGYCASLTTIEGGSSEWVMLKAAGDCKYSIKSSSLSTWNATLYVHLAAALIHLLYVKGLVHPVHKHWVKPKISEGHN